METLRRRGKVGNSEIIVYLALVLLFSAGAEVACAMEVTPIDDFASSGVVGGPFNPPSKQYQLKNTGLDSLVWGIDKDAYWLDLDEEFGTLDPNETATVTVSINSNADTLPAGAHTDTLTFVDITNDQIQTREVVLTVIGLQGLLYVTPAENFESVGVIGGPFIPSSKEYLLTNIGGQSLFWGADVNEDWLELDDTFGSLDPSQSITITVSLTTTAATLPVDLYTDIVIFQDLTNTQEYTRDAILTVRPWLTFHVDVISGDDNNNGMSKESAFATIQKAIEVAGNGDWILVWPGVYQESINYLGKSITLTSAADAAILQAPNDDAVTMYTAEDANSVLTNFVIRNSDMAVFLDGASPTLKNLTIVNNEFGIGAYSDSEPDISNCIFWNNLEGDLFQCSARYSFTHDPNDAPSFYFSFDEGEGATVYDSIGNIQGLVNGANWVDGYVNGALSFDGNNDYVDMGASSSYKLMDDISVCAWVNRDSTGAILVIEGGSGESSVDNTIFWLDVYYGGSQEIQYAHEYGSGINAEHLFSGVPLNIWSHVVIVRDSDAKTVKAYIDAVDVGTFNYINQPENPASEVNMIIGGRTYGASYEKYFDGIIDEVMIFDRVLVPNEIEILYQIGLSGQGYEIVSPGFADPIGGDYHLLSQRGRYRPSTDDWILDKVTSPGVDGGDPTDYPSGERMPNGGRINMGAYGGTDYASMSDWPLAEDYNRDGRIDLDDFVRLAAAWLQTLPWAD